MHMNESNGGKMGPREDRFRRNLDILDDRSLEVAQKANDGVGPIVQRLRLADALGEALYEWKELLDAYVENRPPPDERPEIAVHDAKIIERLRAILAEVDRG